jgi:hypothetical protein
MGKYTEHWDRYKQESKKQTIVLLLLIAIGLPGTALVAYLISLVTGEYPALIHLGMLGAWLVLFTTLAVRASKVVCPQCGTVYSRGKSLSNCPHCGLRMLQDEP